MSDLNRGAPALTEKFSIGGAETIRTPGYQPSLSGGACRI